MSVDVFNWMVIFAHFLIILSCMCVAGRRSAVIRVGVHSVAVQSPSNVTFVLSPFDRWRWNKWSRCAWTSDSPASGSPVRPLRHADVEGTWTAWIVSGHRIHNLLERIQFRQVGFRCITSTLAYYAFLQVARFYPNVTTFGYLLSQIRLSSVYRLCLSVLSNHQLPLNFRTTWRLKIIHYQIWPTYLYFLLNKSSFQLPFFSYIVAPTVWNTLPPSICSPQTLNSFWMHRKTQFFQSAFKNP